VDRVTHRNPWRKAARRAWGLPLRVPTVTATLAAALCPRRAMTDLTGRCVSLRPARSVAPGRAQDVMGARDCLRDTRIRTVRASARRLRRHLRTPKVRSTWPGPRTALPQLIVSRSTWLEALGDLEVRASRLRYGGGLTDVRGLDDPACSPSQRPRASTHVEAERGRQVLRAVGRNHTRLVHHLVGDRDDAPRLA